MNTLLRSLLVLIAVSFACVGPACTSQNTDETGDNDGEENRAPSGDVEPADEMLTHIKELVGQSKLADFDTACRAARKLRGMFPDAVPKLLALAKDPAYPDRFKALTLLSHGDGDRLGPHKEQVCAFVREAITDDSPELRAAALHAMEPLHMPEFTNNLLREKFKDPAAIVRGEVMDILWGRLYGWHSDKLDRDMLLLVVQGLTDKGGNVSAKAIEVLADARAKAKPVADELRKLTNHSDVTVRGAVITSLAICGPAAQDIPTILAACKDPNPALQLTAMQALLQMDPSDPRVTATAMAALDNSPNAEITVAAATALGTARPVKAETVAHLARIIRNESASEQVREACINALWAMGPAASSAADLLIEQRRNGRPTLRGACLRALWRVAPEHPELIKTVKASINSGDIWSIERCIVSLGKRNTIFAPDLLNAVATMNVRNQARWCIVELLSKVHDLPPKQAIPLLTNLLAEGNYNFRDRVYKAIGSMGPRAAAGVPALLKKIRQYDDFDSLDAIEALGRIGPAAMNAAPLLNKYFADPKTHKSEHPSVWHSAAVALARIDPSIRGSIVRTLCDDLRQSGIETRTSALCALGELGHLAGAAARDIRPLLAHEDTRLSAGAVRALAHIGKPGPMVEILIQDLKSDQADRQQRACNIIMNTGPVAKQTLPMLRELHRREDDILSGFAAGAIHAITGEDIYGKKGSRSLPTPLWRN